MPQCSTKYPCDHAILNSFRIHMDQLWKEQCPPGIINRPQNVFWICFTFPEQKVKGEDGSDRNAYNRGMSFPLRNEQKWRRENFLRAPEKNECASSPLALTIKNIFFAFRNAEKAMIRLWLCYVRGSLEFQKGQAMVRLGDALMVTCGSLLLGCTPMWSTFYLFP